MVLVFEAGIGVKQSTVLQARKALDHPSANEFSPGTQCLLTCMPRTLTLWPNKGTIGDRCGPTQG